MRIDIPEQKKLVHETTIPMRWGDMDAIGHMNNTVYFRFMETARIEWLRELGFDASSQGEGMVIVNAFCNFVRQFEYPCSVVARTYVSNPGRSSFDTWVLMERADQPGVLYASGGATVCWVDFQKQKSMPLPERLRELLER
ncbi:MAG: acyl-CoA thioesterase [Proteobacteria bacterium]|nr:acyl-CoA thioesterase [Pseudomonadota bacterium]